MTGKFTFQFVSNVHAQPSARQLYLALCVRHLFSLYIAGLNSKGSGETPYLLRLSLILCVLYFHLKNSLQSKKHLASRNMQNWVFKCRICTFDVMQTCRLI